MRRMMCRSVCLSAILMMTTTPVFAQRGGGGGGGGGRGAGGPGGPGGGMCSGMNGAGGAGMMSGFFGNMAIAGGRQNSQRQMFNPQNLPQMQNSLLAAEMAARQSQKAVPTPEQFVAAAMNFDADQSTELDSAELTLVATAVITELRMRQRGMPNRGTSADNGLTAFSPPPPRPPNDGRTPAVPSSPAAVMQQMTAAFVNKALTFDVDGSGALNAAETQQMAIAFLRSLS